MSTKLEDGQLPGLVPCAVMLRRSGTGVIRSTRQLGMGKKSGMADAMGSHAGLTNYRSAPVTIHAKCGRAPAVDAAAAQLQRRR